MHPEDVRHLAAGGGSFQLGPVFVPAGNLHFDGDVGILCGVGGAHGLHACLLGNVPDLEGQVHFSVGGTAGASTADKAEGQCNHEDHSNDFGTHSHVHSPFVVEMG